ncbi:hypothetical protein AB0D08_27690 [Kitasatospora sp. NPDC048540]|uniref:hypothetical protein n=1 Tax=Kitasatospora sp. NPDC048540 TaxID=3155634 RepID=UPI0034005491
MTACEMDNCQGEATHVAVLTLTGETEETWQVCREHDRQLKLAAVRSRAQVMPLTEEPVLAQCLNCGQALEDANPPCPICGSRDRAITIGDLATVHEAVRLRTKRAGKGGWIVQIDTGDNYTRDLSAWGRRELTLDGEQNRYREVIELYEGSRIVSTAKLTDHQG